MKFRPFLCGMLACWICASGVLSQKKIPVPKWKPGYTAFYLIRLKAERNIKTKSALTLPDTPNQTKTDVRGVLQIQIAEDKNSSANSVRLRTRFVDFREYLGAQATAISPAEDKFVEATLQRDGRLTEITGFKELSAEQQDAWNEWATRFSAAFLFETQGHKSGDKWNSEEPETSPSPIAQLLWQKRSHYVHDEPCTSVKLNPQGESQRAATKETCAVILTTASLLQKSSQQDATPQDYKLRGLRTRGTVKGMNQTILYISKATGQLIRATEDANQQMAVQIALSNGTNHVQYDVAASANNSVELVTELTLNPRP